MPTNETPTDSKPRWGALAKGAVGTAVLAVGGYFGAAMMQIISAPKDSVAYDFIQSATGMLKPAPQDGPAPAQAQRPTAPPSAAPSEPHPAPKAAFATPAPAIPGLSPPAISPSPASPAPVGSPSPDLQPQPAPGATMQERVQQTTRLAAQTRASIAALANSRILSLGDRAKAPICGADYDIEVSSVAAGAGQVVLRGSAVPITLAVGQPPRELAAGCRIVLLSTMEDLANRRAQLREISVK